MWESDEEEEKKEAKFKKLRGFPVDFFHPLAPNPKPCTAEGSICGQLQECSLSGHFKPPLAQRKAACLGNPERFFSLTETARRESSEEFELHSVRAVWGHPWGRGPAAGAGLPRLPALRRRGQLGQPPAVQLRPGHRLARLRAQVRDNRLSCTSAV